MTLIRSSTASEGPPPSEHRAKSHDHPSQQTKEAEETVGMMGSVGENCADMINDQSTVVVSIEGRLSLDQDQPESEVEEDEDDSLKLTQNDVVSMRRYMASSSLLQAQVMTIACIYLFLHSFYLFCHPPHKYI
jgi:hypothetical protein